ncbi:MAG: aconitase X catalytic domain-containing protein [Oscillospiraceae bacterium]
MLQLTNYEQEMLAGKYGAFQQTALKNIVAYAKVLGAEALCEVSKATIYLGAHPYLEVVDSENYDEVFSKMLLCSDETIPVGSFAKNCVCQTCVTPCDQYEYESLHVSRQQFEKNLRYLEIVRKSGVSLANSCTPYLTGWIPLMGEHFVTTESSNVLMCNAVFGACGNSDGIEAAAWSAICGRTPLWGNHIRENRYATHAFRIDCPSETALDWDLIGYTVGRHLPPHAIPILVGNFHRPDIVKLKQCFASMATTSGAEMCHIEGITPEAVTFEMAANGKKLPETVISEEDYLESLQMLCDRPGGEVQFVSLGCPHYTLSELREAALYLEGKKIHEGVSLYLWTDVSIKEMANISGYTAMIEQAGGKLLTSSCPLVIGHSCHAGVTGMAMDGAKQAHYIRSESKARVYYGTMFACIDAAISGRWEDQK